MKGAATGYFVKIQGPRTRVVRRLPASGCVVIGSRGADIEIDEPSLSPRHAVLHVGARLAIEDRDSQHGTRLAGRALRPGVRHPLAVGATADLGAVRLCVLRHEAGHDAPPPPARVAAGPRVEDEARDPAPAPGDHRPPARAAELDPSLDRVAATELGVLLLGEHGVGKSFLAEKLHARSPRAGGPFVRLHCGAPSEALLERDLFGCAGHAEGVGVEGRGGVLERAQRGTVFLDAVGELPLSLQARLLAAIERRDVVRPGDLEPRPLDVRFIAASHLALDAEVARGRFRRDLYLRLGAVRLQVPPLRERGPELRCLADAFVSSACRAAAIASAPAITSEAWALLERHAWPGNLRELRNVIQQAVLLASEGRITPAELPLDLQRATGAADAAASGRLGTEPGDEPRGASDDGERAQIIEALLKCAGNQTRAARLLGISRGTLIARMESYALPRPRKRGG